MRDFETGINSGMSRRKRHEMKQSPTEDQVLAIVKDFDADGMHSGYWSSDPQNVKDVWKKLETDGAIRRRPPIPFGTGEWFISFELVN